FLMACSLESRSLFQALLRPWPALWATLLSYGLLPILGWLVGGLVAHEDLRIGLMLTASVPCTLASAVLWTRLAGGREATAQLLVLSIILKAAVDVRDQLGTRAEALPGAEILLACVLALGLHLTALFSGLTSSGLLGFDRADRIAIAFACSQKTLPVALFLF